MFKNREFRVRVAKTNDTTTTTNEHHSLSPEDINLLKSAALNVALFAGGIWLSGKVIDAACEIIIKKL